VWNLSCFQREQHTLLRGLGLRGIELSTAAFDSTFGFRYVFIPSFPFSSKLPFHSPLFFVCCLFQRTKQHPLAFPSTRVEPLSIPTTASSPIAAYQKVVLCNTFFVTDNEIQDLMLDVLDERSCRRILCSAS
jgi:hypothetical protein